MSSLPELPFDIFVQILSHLPLTDDGTLTVVACLSASRLLASAASTPSLWEARYHLRYRHSVERLQDTRQELYAGNYKAMYTARVRIDQQALVLLSQIIYAESTDTRIAKFNELAELSWDVWDVLQRESLRPVPFDKVDQAQIPPTGTDESPLTARPLPLTWRFWSSRARQAIGGRYAFRKWHTLYSTSAPNTTLCEESLNAISCFYSFSPFELARKLDKLAEECREHLRSVNCTVDQEHANFDLKETATHVSAFLRLAGYTPVSERDFRRVENSLPHRYMHDCQDTIPLSLVHIFLGIIRRLGIEGYYVNFPNRLLACMNRTKGDSTETVWVDVFEPACLDQSDMVEASQIFQSDWPTFRNHIMEGSNYNILIRSMGNLLACRSPDHKPYYVAHIPQLLRTPFNMNTVLNILHHLDDPRLESSTFLLPALKEVLPPQDYGALSALFSPALHTLPVPGESQAENVSSKRREGQDITVKHRVGMFFRHVKYSYYGLIRGWDYKCEMDEGWIYAMRVDSTLPRGRNQPFYSTIDTEGTERYVAEENICTCSVSEEVAECFFGPNSSTGRNFSDAKIEDKSVLYLVPSPELLAQYPEDGQDE